MDLTNLTRADLAELQGRLRVIGTAADVLAEGGLEPVVDLEAWETVLRCGPLRAPDVAWNAPIVVEDEVAAEGSALDDTGAAAETTQPLSWITDAETIDRHLWGLSRLNDWHMGADLKLLKMAVSGWRADEIAVAMGRPLEEVQARFWVLNDQGRFPLVAVLERLEHLMARVEGDQPVADSAATEDDTGAAEAPQPEPAGGQDADAPPPEEMLGGDGGGLQRHVHAEYDPLQTGGAVSAPPVEAPACETTMTDEDPAPLVPVQEPPAAVLGTPAAVEAPALPADRPTPVGGQGGGAVSAQAATIWTAAEDARMVEIVARQLVQGATKGAAAALAAAELGRPVEGARWRANTKLKDRIDQAVTVLRGVKTAPPAASVEAAPVPAKPVAAAPLRPVAPAHLAGEHLRIWNWLDGLPQKPPFDPEADLAIYDAHDSGKGVHGLALDWGLDTAVLVHRFREMTRCICDAKNKIRPELKMKFSAVVRWRAEAFAKLKAA